MENSNDFERLKEKCNAQADYIQQITEEKESDALMIDGLKKQLADGKDSFEKEIEKLNIEISQLKNETSRLKAENVSANETVSRLMEQEASNGNQTEIIAELEKRSIEDKAVAEKEIERLNNEISRLLAEVSTSNENTSRTLNENNMSPKLNGFIGSFKKILDKATAEKIFLNPETDSIYPPKYVDIEYNDFISIMQNIVDKRDFNIFMEISVLFGLIMEPKESSGQEKEYHLPRMYEGKKLLVIRIKKAAADYICDCLRMLN